MTATQPGVFTAQVPTSSTGVYRILTRAEGADLHGVRFTREELRTLAVWARGDDPPPVVIEPGGTDTHVDTCGLLLCLLDDDGVARLLETTASTRGAMRSASEAPAAERAQRAEQTSLAGMLSAGSPRVPPRHGPLDDGEELAVGSTGS